MGYLKEKIQENIVAIGITIVILGYFLYSTFSQPATIVENDQVSEHAKTAATTVEKTKLVKIVIDVKGAITKPGVYELENGKRIKDIIELAGGFKGANEICVNLAQLLKDEQKIIIPRSEEECTSSLVNQTEEGVQIVNLNTATELELMTLPGIGEGRAKAIIEYREKSGNFQTIDDLKNVSGFGESTFEKLKDAITVWKCNCN
ncbi:MAG: helix-hairpin-helix domain-containing protein [Mycoplasmatales bacterium]